MADDTPAVTAALADYVAASLDRPLPDDVADLARHHLLDTLAAIVACCDLPAARLAARYAVAAAGQGSGGGGGIAAAIEAIRIDMPGRADAFATAEMPALNLPYLCAVIVLDGGLGVESSQSRGRMLVDPAVRALMARVTVTHDPDQEREPRAESARVTVALAGGESVSRFVGEVEGFPSHPMPGPAVEAKARRLLSPALGDGGADRVVDLVAGIEDLPSVEPLVAALEPAS